MFEEILMDNEELVNVVEDLISEMLQNRYKNFDELDKEFLTLNM